MIVYPVIGLEYNVVDYTAIHVIKNRYLYKYRSCKYFDMTQNYNTQIIFVIIYYSNRSLMFIITIYIQIIITTCLLNNVLDICYICDTGGMLGLL